MFFTECLIGFTYLEGNHHVGQIDRGGFRGKRQVHREDLRRLR
jgi:hypothetical protein